VTGDESEYVAALKAIRERDKANGYTAAGLPIATVLDPSRSRRPLLGVQEGSHRWL
jgi:hypothetical protein